MNVWYGIVTLFIHGISFRYIYIQVYKTNYLTKLESKIKTKIGKMKRKHLLFTEAVCKKRSLNSTLMSSLPTTMDVQMSVQGRESQLKPIAVVI